MANNASSWIVFYKKDDSNCSLNFLFDGSPSLADVAQILAKTLGVAGAVISLSAPRNGDGAAQDFLNMLGMTDIAFTPFIERRKVHRA